MLNSNSRISLNEFIFILTGDVKDQANLRRFFQIWTFPNQTLKTSAVKWWKNWLQSVFLPNEPHTCPIPLESNNKKDRKIRNFNYNRRAEWAGIDLNNGMRIQNRLSMVLGQIMAIRTVTRRCRERQVDDHLCREVGRTVAYQMNNTNTCYQLFKSSVHFL